MKTTTAATLSLVALASAAVPDTAYHFNRLITGYAGACRGADTIDVKVTPEVLTWDLQDFSGKYNDKEQNPTYCVMDNDIYRAPGNWRFAFESATYSGNVKLTGGAQVKTLGTYLDMSASYVTNPPASVNTTVWAMQTGHMGDFIVSNTTLDADESGNFEVETKPDTEGWSPCFFKNSTTDYFKFQLSHQTILYFEDSADAQAEFGPGLKLALKMKWEECDASLDAMSKWGKKFDVPEGWNPYV
ncbi:uncharacterized protein F4822DRAFT_433343 [Hypoxylon trugodes]|uniref:uncharacterized protein n=1 Tax=Hypoxylon trugodes TaxID=326681 RepID=UPI00219471C1|nr:uncharacterized protein F4822DRAFT_433343 [Hypoxylon trugodes]KAI1384803.1 hypothetical protein F4822DRAFT_433343 [Hypoxylon trugodes]